MSASLGVTGHQGDKAPSLPATCGVAAAWAVVQTNPRTSVSFDRLYNLGCLLQRQELLGLVRRGSLAAATQRQTPELTSEVKGVETEEEQLCLIADTTEAWPGGIHLASPKPLKNENDNT